MPSMTRPARFRIRLGAWCHGILDLIDTNNLRGLYEACRRSEITVGRAPRPACQCGRGRGRGFSQQACRFVDRGRYQRVVRHGHLPERKVMTGIGPVAGRQPLVRDRKASATDPGRNRFTPSILPPYMRRSKPIETSLPILYLEVSRPATFFEALAALLGKDAAGLSASAIGCLKDGWFKSMPPDRSRSIGEAQRHSSGLTASLGELPERFGAPV